MADYNRSEAYDLSLYNMPALKPAYEPEREVKRPERKPQSAERIRKESVASALRAVKLFMVSAVLLLLFGSVLTLLYSLAGAALSFLAMLIFKRIGIFSSVGVSIIGGVMHNAGQIAVACIVMETAALGLYFPVLIVSGVIAGVAVGIIAGLVAKRLGGTVGKL